MAFRIDDISIHLMPLDEKDKEDKEKKEKKDKEVTGVTGQPCTVATGPDNTAEVEASGSRGGLAFLQARLREALAPPPL